MLSVTSRTTERLKQPDHRIREDLVRGFWLSSL